MADVTDEFRRGVEQFNQQQFYDCHDTLEAIWIDAVPSEKNFYQGILQIAVALHHLSNLNWRGAVILMGEGINRLQAYQPAYEGIDVENFVLETALLLKYLQQVELDRVEEIAQQLGLRGDESSGSIQPSSDLKLPTIRITSN